MRRQLAGALGALALGWLGNAAWAQEPPTSGLPQPTPVTAAVVEAPTPTKAVTPEQAGVKIQAENAPVISRGYGVLGNWACQGCGHDCGQWIAGGGIYILQPRWDSNPAFQINAGDGLGNDARTLRDFDHGSNVAPMVFLGYEWASGFGIRGRWFGFESDDTQTFTNTVVAPATSVVSPANPLGLGINGTGADGAIINATSNLSLYAFDVEATKRITNNCWSLLMAAGVRYAHIAQDYNYLSVNPDTSSERILGAHSFNGIGPTLAIEGRRQIGGCGFALYGSARGSILFGKSNESATQIVTDDTGAVTETDTGAASRNQILSIGELEVGAEYGRDFGRFRFVGQVGFVGQVWWGAGNSANVDNHLGADNASNLGLVGVAIRAGIGF